MSQERSLQHQQLLELFVGSATEFISAFSRIITHTEEITILSRAIVLILSTTDSIVPVLEWSLNMEFEDAETSAHLFRDGLHMVILSEYYRIFGGPYTDFMIGKCMKGTIDNYKKLKLEVIPSVAKDHMENALILQELADLFLDSICNSADSCPIDFRHILIALSNLSKEKYPTEYLQIVGGFFFSKLVIPAIQSPEQYGFGKELQKRTAVCLAKLLHLIAVNSATGFMCKFKDFVDNSQPKVTKFINKLIKPPTAAIKTAITLPKCTPDGTLVALKCLQYYMYWYCQDFGDEEKPPDHPFTKMQNLMQEWELLDGKPDPVDERDLRVDFVFQPKTARGTRQGFFKRKKTNATNPTAHLTLRHQSHLQNLEEQTGIKFVNSKQFIVEESADESDKISGESSSAADSEISLSEAEEARLRSLSEASPQPRPKKNRRSITTTTAQQLQDKKMAEFNIKLMQSLIYRQERDRQVRTAALNLKYNYFPALDDDLWDWKRATPAMRASFLRGVITQREYPMSPMEKPKTKKLAKSDRRPSRNNLKASDAVIKQAKRGVRKSYKLPETLQNKSGKVLEGKNKISEVKNTEARELDRERSKSVTLPVREVILTSGEGEKCDV